MGNILVPLWKWGALIDLEQTVDLFLNGRVDQSSLAMAHYRATIEPLESTDEQEQEDPDYYTDDRDDDPYWDREDEYYADDSYDD